MAFNYKKGIESLKVELASLEREGFWQEKEYLHQFRHKNGGILNFLTKLGRVHFQGKEKSGDILKEKVDEILSRQNAIASSLGIDEVALKLEPGDINVADRAERDERSVSNFKDSEIVIGLVAPVGADLEKVSTMVQDFLKKAGYSPTEIKISKQVIPDLVSVKKEYKNEVSRINSLMDAGNEARRVHKNGGVLAIGAAAKISDTRELKGGHQARRAYIVNSLKHPDEVTQLRRIYPDGFYLIGVFVDDDVRINFLTGKDVPEDEIESLIERDRDEEIEYGQRVNDAFHLSDFFVRMEKNELKLRNSVLRIIQILFGNPFKTPTFDEFAMFLAFAASLRSADLSRQVGAIISKNKEVIATGANDCPKAGGGLYWPEYDSDNNEIRDLENGRDYTRKMDSNRQEQQKIMSEIEKEFTEKGFDVEVVRNVLSKSRINDLTEYGRVVHAEMEAILSCARNHTSTKDAQLFCTTFPCHNCAKHIIASGINRVVFIEPYYKSKALEFHDDSITLGFDGQQPMVKFEPFIGVGPRRFFDLFSMKLSAGYNIKRKEESGEVVNWALSKDSILRVQMLPANYLVHEKEAYALLETLKASKNIAKRRPRSN